MAKINVKDAEITIITVEERDYISLTLQAVSSLKSSTGAFLNGRPSYGLHFHFNVQSDKNEQNIIRMHLDEY